ncbi:hypothetical protein EYF80_005299 [Liparis tanakae]|uniref:Uncharacterized protein n=1 Tax=Liparis tanakae TaxID=230148 RepID=A0A4Z2J2A6_9TELE|nr:hypothetical protein EYF80_005299 [Liparis tanakae]
MVLAMRPTRILLLHADSVLMEIAFSTVTAERALCVGTDLIQTVTGQHPLAPSHNTTYASPVTFITTVIIIIIIIIIIIFAGQDEYNSAAPAVQLQQLGVQPWQRPQSALLLPAPLVHTHAEALVTELGPESAH